jgi:hypothetical protein
MATSVYWIHHPDHTDMFSQGYIGVSNDTERRFKQHFEKKQNPHLVNAIQKYGWENLIKKKILISEKDYCYDIEGKLRPMENIGWNIAVGGGVPPKPLKVHTIGMRLKRSALNKIRHQNPVAREKFSKSRLGLTAWNKGQKASPETVEKQRISHLGKPSGKKGKATSAETIAKLKATFEANPWTCPHCNKVGLNKGLGNRWHFDNCKEKL